MISLTGFKNSFVFCQVVNPSSFWCGPTPNVLPEVRDVSLDVCASIYTNENDDDDDEEET